MALFPNAEAGCATHAAGKGFNAIETALLRAQGSGEGEFHSKS